MRIAVWHNLPSGGGKRALYGQVAGLVERGHRIEIWCPECADCTYLPLSELATETRLPFAPRLRGTSTGLGRFVYRERNADDQLREMDRHSRECAKAIMGGGFDIIFASPCVFYRVPRLGRFLTGLGIPVVLYLQEPFRELYEAMPELPWLAPKVTDGSLFSLGAVRSRLEDTQRIRMCRKNARREVEDAKCYDLILANSYFSRESIARAYNLSARVSYLGCDTSLFRPLGLPRENFVIGLGSAHWIKGVGTAIEAVARLKEPRPRLVWVANSGDPSYGAEMQSLAAKLHVELEFKSRIGDDELVGLLNRAQLLIYTSHLEPFGYAPIEANACGTPVVAVAEGGVRETVFDGVNGLLCDRDPADLAAAMQRVLADSAFAKKLGNAGRHEAESRWGWDASINELEHHFERILEERRKTGSMEHQGRCV